MLNYEFKLIKHQFGLAEYNSSIHTSSLIVNGFPTFNRRFLVRIRYLYAHSNFCVGTIIDRFWIVTSGMCMRYGKGNLSKCRFTNQNKNINAWSNLCYV